MQDYLAVAVLPASQAEAEAFTENTKPMTPLRTQQAVTESYYQRFVAASDSPARRILMAHYVCDGTADQVQIQAAIDAIAATGGEVVLEKGEFSTTASISITTSNITLRGRGTDTIINPVWDSGNILDKVISVQGAADPYITNVTICDLSIVTDAPYDFTPTGFVGEQWCRIWCQYVEHLRVANVHVTRVGIGLDARNCRDITVDNLTSYQCAITTASVYNERMLISNVRGHDCRVVIDLAVCNDVQMSNIQGTATTLGVTDFYVTGIDVGGSTSVTINGFNLDGFYYGISAKYEETRFHDIVIANGVITQSVAKGIHSDKNALATGDKLGPVTISNVIIKSTVANSQGVHLNGYSENDAVVGCTIAVDAYGVLIEGSDNARVIGNKIASTSFDAVYVGKINSTHESNNALIAGNILSGGDTGVWISQCVGPIVENNHILSAGTHGIWALECKRPKIRTNTIDSAGTHGIYVQWQSETYLDSTGRTMRFSVDDNMVAGYVNRGVLVDMSGVAGAAYSVGSINRNQIFGDAANTGIGIVGSVTFEKVFVQDNQLENTAAPFRTDGATMGTSCRYSGNTGFLTESNGTAVVANGTTSIVVNHGLGTAIFKTLTPAAKDITITPTNDLGTAAKWWVDTLTATQFTINVDADPGAGTATFEWSIRVLNGF